MSPERPDAAPLGAEEVTSLADHFWSLAEEYIEYEAEIIRLRRAEQPLGEAMQRLHAFEAKLIDEDKTTEPFLRLFDTTDQSSAMQAAFVNLAVSRQAARGDSVRSMKESLDIFRDLQVAIGRMVRVNLQLELGYTPKDSPLEVIDLRLEKVEVDVVDEYPTRVILTGRDSNGKTQMLAISATQLYQRITIG